MADTVGQVSIRGEHIERAVTGFALEAYKMKPLVMTSTSSSWKESYFQESKAELAAGTTARIKGIPRLAKFPTGNVTWTKKDAFMTKYGFEGTMPWEDIRTNAIDVQQRTFLRIARAVTNSVDTEIWDVLSQGASTSNGVAPSDINSVTLAAGKEWDSSTLANRDPIQNILDARKEITIDNYDIGTKGFLVVSPTDFANILGNANVRNAGQFYTDDVTRNGRVGKLAGLKVVEANVVTASFAMVLIAKECATWQTAAPLTVKTIDDPGVSLTIRAWEVGVTQLTNPEAVCLIINTQK